MKSLKKILSIFAAFMMVVGLTAVNTNAAQINENSGEGSITINNPVKNQEYTVFKIFDANPVEDKTQDSVVNPGVTTTDERQVSYLATDNEVKFFSGEDANLTAQTVESTYFTFSKTPQGSWNVAAKTNVKGAEIAAYIQAEAKKLNSTDPITALTTKFDYKKATSSTGDPLTISGLPLGYYFVWDNQGALASINTTTPNVTISDKNVPSKPDKTVKDGENYVDHIASTMIGQTLNYQVKFTIQPGLTKLTVTDAPNTGMVFVAGSLSVSTNANLTVKYLDKDDKEIDEVNAQNQESVRKIVIDYAQSYLDSIKTPTEVTITYQAMITKDALTLNTTSNKVTVDDGHHSDTDEDTVNVFFGAQNIFKFEVKEGTNSALATAKFNLMSGTKAMTFLQDPTTKEYYPVAADTTGASTDLVSGEDGYIKIKGLPVGEYVLKEIQAPDGYNLAVESWDIKVAETRNEQNELTGVITTTKVTNATGNATTSEIQVENKKGSTLPSTGGMGTTMIYIAGAILMVGAAIIFVTNKRMKHE